MRAMVGLAVCAMLAGCGTPRAHAGIHITRSGVRVAPSVSTSIAGVGVTVSE